MNKNFKLIIKEEAKVDVNGTPQTLTDASIVYANLARRGRFVFKLNGEIAAVSERYVEVIERW